LNIFRVDTRWIPEPELPVPTATLTKRAMEAAKPPKSGSYVLWDDRLPGFGCKLTPKGKRMPEGRRILFFQYWSPVQRGKRRRVTFGLLGGTYSHPDGRTVPITAHTARELAEAARGIVAAGRDPYLERERTERAKLEREAEAARARDARRVEDATRRPFAIVAEECLEEWRERLTMPIGATRRLSPRTVAERERLLVKHILPVLGRRPLAEIGPADAEAVRKALGTRAPIVANRVQSLCHLILATARPEAPNPFTLGKARRAQWFEERETRQPITREELGRLLAALDADDPLERGGAHDAIRLLAFTGWRKKEALSLRWDAVDLDTGDVRLGQTKTGASVRSLTPQAVALLAGIPRRGPYVFPSPTDALAARQEVKRVWLRVRDAAGITKPLHALRHGFATIALSEGLPLATVGALLGHRAPSTTLRYAKLEDARRREGAATVGDALARVTTSAPDVLPMRRRTR
jgi:integrase